MRSLLFFSGLGLLLTLAGAGCGKSDRNPSIKEGAGKPPPNLERKTPAGAGGGAGQAPKSE